MKLNCGYNCQSIRHRDTLSQVSLLPRLHYRLPTQSWKGMEEDKKLPEYPT